MASRSQQSSAKTTRTRSPFDKSWLPDATIRVPSASRHSLAVHSVIQPNSGHRDYSRLSGGVEDTRTFSLLPPGVEVRPVLAAPSIKFPVPRKNSLIRVCKFPALLHREFA